ncbi:MAG: FHA domain-containing protein [Lachnospiraceae bacterium]|nr:FHA domain-containing protein [Lachnospiraceae bacterium]
MQFSYENQNSSSFLVYELAEDEELDTLGMGMLTNNQIPGILPVNFVQMDEKRYLRFNISSKISLEDMFSGNVNKTRLLNVISSLCDAFSGTKEYLLDNGMFVLESRYMFADISTGKTRLVYLPVERKVEEPNLKALIWEILSSVQYDESEDSGYIAKLMNYLNGSNELNLVEFSTILQDLKVGAFIGENNSAGNETQSFPQVSIMPPFQSPNQQAYQSMNQQSYPSLNQQSYLPPNQYTYQSQVQKRTSEPAHSFSRENDSGRTSGTTILGKNAFSSLSSDRPLRTQENDYAQEQNVSQDQNKKKVLFGFMRRGDDAARGTSSESTGRSTEQNGTVPLTRSSGASSNSYVRKQVFGSNQNQQIDPAFGSVSGQYEAQAQPDYQVRRNAPIGTAPLNRANRTSTGTTILNGGAGGFARTSEPYIPVLILRRERNGQEVRISKSVFHIGSEYGYADFYISDNNAISRSHADIIVRGSKYFLKDTNSMNHTYLNGEMLTSNEEYTLRSGDRIILADESFEFYVK